MGQENRKVRNYFINPAFQTRISYYFVALSVGLMGLMIALMNVHLNDLKDIIANISGLPISAQIEMNDKLAKLLATAIGFLFASLAAAVVYGIIISHRIAGPMFAILRYIDGLKSGRYEDKRSLRPYDELAPIMNALHELAEDLKSKKS